MSQIPESTPLSIGLWLCVLLNLMGHVRHRLEDHKHFHSPLYFDCLFLGLGTVEWVSPPTSCFAFCLGPATFGVTNRNLIR